MKEQSTVKTLFSVCEAKNPHTVQYAIDERTKKTLGKPI